VAQWQTGSNIAPEVLEDRLSNIGTEEGLERRFRVETAFRASIAAENFAE
jgi:hypothetical protein